MATPGEYASAMLDFAGLEISTAIRNLLPINSVILDIGAGWGKYKFLLPEYEMDAVDIWEPYVKQNKLDAYYRAIYIVNAAEFNYPQRYDAIIMGDVLEHLPVEEAQQMVRSACNNATYVFIATPFLMKQPEVDGNPHEEHKQADLTEGVMEDRYPELELYKFKAKDNEHTKAIYVKKGSL